MEELRKESALPEAATPEQSKKVKPVYEDVSINDLIAQVVEPTLELIRIAGEGKRHFAISYGGVFLSVFETEVKSDRSYEYKHDWVDVLVDTEVHSVDRVKQELICAADTMRDLLGSVRKELEDGTL